jgi:hypothetical protein
MKNCWNQEILPGDLVYRGARQGNSSEYKIGIIEHMKPGKNPRVKYIFEQSGTWIKIAGLSYWIPYPKKLESSFGSPASDSLIKVELDLEEIERQASFFDQVPYGTSFSSREQLDSSLAAWTI